ncbi:MAG: NAD(P) transhydrogenase subunit alpha [Filimonas sp.]|nr:NAD(P) transhydrogenase subunit alpha [Filimonas sp.]
MIIAILKEKSPERRVSFLLEQVEQLVKQNNTLLIETGAGLNAFVSDEDYIKKGAATVTRTEALQAAQIILSIHVLSEEDISFIKPGTILLGVFQPLYNTTEMELLASKGITVFSLDMLPRTTRAQSMDVLSSQANIAGYKAVLLAAQLYPRYLPMFMTAAGSIPPAKMLVIGAGVAGLQAIATSRRLGAVVEVFDTRPAVKEEVMSLGAKFIDVEGAADASKAGGYAVEQTEEYKQRQQQKIADAVAKADMVVTTAQIPGKKAPQLITLEMLNQMRAGSVIIDLAAASGGNTAVTANDETVMHNGVTVIGAGNLPATMPYDASRLYGKNCINFLQLIVNKSGELFLNFEDDLVKGACITYEGNIVHDRVKTVQ